MRQTENLWIETEGKLDRPMNVCLSLHHRRMQTWTKRTVRQTKTAKDSDRKRRETKDSGIEKRTREPYASERGLERDQLPGRPGRNNGKRKIKKEKKRKNPLRVTK